ncbi:MAG: hypothetical protein V4548_10640 [Bacteroidota bacterium]
MRIRILIILILFTYISVQSQEKPISKNSISGGIGLGSSDGIKEVGFGAVFSLGYHRSFGTKNRFRLNPNFVYGGFSTTLIEDAGEHEFKIKSLELNAHYDVIKYKAFSFFLTLGGFISDSKGTSTSGGELSNPADYPKDFNHTYSGFTTGFGIGIKQPDFPITLEIKILNIQFGKNDYDLGYFMIGANVKI